MLVDRSDAGGRGAESAAIFLGADDPEADEEATDDHLAFSESHCRSSRCRDGSEKEWQQPAALTTTFGVRALPQL